LNHQLAWPINPVEVKKATGSEPHHDSHPFHLWATPHQPVKPGESAGTRACLTRVRSQSPTVQACSGALYFEEALSDFLPFHSFGSSMRMLYLLSITATLYGTVKLTGMLKNISIPHL
jgi:hypothetical protein